MLNTKIGLHTTTHHHHPPTHHKLFSQKGLSQGSEILHGVLTHKTNKIYVKEKIGGPPSAPPPSVCDFLGLKKSL